MALFLKGREGFLGGDIDFDTNKLKAVLINMAAAGPTANAWVITGVTNVVNPTVTTQAAHGLTTGQTVEIFGVLGATGVNGVKVVASTPTSTTFTITQAAPGAYTSGGHLANLSLTFLSQFAPVGARIATSGTLTGPSITDGVAKLSNPTTFSAVPGPNPVHGILVVRAAAATGDADLSDAAQRLIWINTPATSGTSGLPVTPNGGDITVTWNAQGLFEI